MKLLTVSAAAAVLGVSRQTLYRWIAAGELRTRLVAGRNRVPESEIERLNRVRRGAA